jgi:flagellar basal-body rod modification protein FlgD
MTTTNTIGSGFNLSSLGLAPPTDTKKTELGQTDFLNLMMTQLKNQDPTKPLDSGQFLGQLAQFGTVSGLQDLQTKFDTLSSSLVSSQALQAASLVGKFALVKSSSAPLASGGAIAGAIDVPAATDSVQVEVRNASGQAVAHLSLGSASAGLARFQWDGTEDDGTQAAPGTYQLVGSYGSGTKTTAADTLVYAPVNSVVLSSDGFTVDVGGVGDVPFSQIREIGY